MERIHLHNLYRMGSLSKPVMVLEEHGIGTAIRVHAATAKATGMLIFSRVIYTEIGNGLKGIPGIQKSENI